jgi:hypoxanthine-guanine phosphoribosyltransferase
MMTTIPECILWCYEEYVSVDGVDFQQGLPDLDTLEIRDKHLIILDDIMDGTKRTKGWLHCLRKRITTETLASCTSFRICFIKKNTIEP